jgi:hypothetical protein
MQPQLRVLRGEQKGMEAVDEEEEQEKLEKLEHETRFSENARCAHVYPSLALSLSLSLSQLLSVPRN